MHETHQVQHLVEDLLRIAGTKKAAKVKKVIVAVGELNGFKPEAMSLIYGDATKGTILAGSTLEVKTLKMQMRCTKCNKAYQPSKDSLTCPVCKVPGQLISTGKEFLLDKIEYDNKFQNKTPL